MARRIQLSLALVPWLAFLTATVVADWFVARTTVSLPGLVASAPLYLAFVALPALVPIAVARARSLVVLAVVVMTAAAGLAGALVVAIDDGQAGLAVLLVPYAALPLAVCIGVTQALVDRYERRS